MRFARSLIWARDSSPDTYSTCFSAESRWHTCRRSVDFPIPGSPPTRTREPGTIPPPSTRSSSSSPVISLTWSSVRTSDRARTCASFRVFTAAVFAVVIISSANVFHSLQAGHCPSHFVSSCPQFWQKYTVFFPFAILLFLILSHSSKRFHLYGWMI